MNTNHVKKRQLIAVMVIALTDARAKVLEDRECLHSSVVNADGAVDEDDQPAIDDYDRVLRQISTALILATGDAL